MLQFPIAAMERAPGGFPQLEVRLKHLEGMFHADDDVLADRFRGHCRVAAAQGVHEILVPSRRVVGIRLPHDAEPDRGQRVRALDRVEQRRAARALRDARVQFLMDVEVDGAIRA